MCKANRAQSPACPAAQAGGSSRFRLSSMPCLGEAGRQCWQPAAAAFDPPVQNSRSTGTLPPLVG